MGKTTYYPPPVLTGNRTSAAQLLAQATQLAAQARQLRRDAHRTAEHIARVNLEQVCREAGTAAGNHVLASLPILAPSFATHYEVAGVRYETGPEARAATAAAYAAETTRCAANQMAPRQAEFIREIKTALFAAAVTLERQATELRAEAKRKAGGHR